MISMIIAQICSISINVIIISEFSIFVRCIQIRFKLVNKLLSEGGTMSTVEKMKLGFSGLFAAEDYTKITGNKQCQKIISIKVLPKHIHLELCRILRTLCTSFGIQVTIEIGTSVIYTTGLLYHLYVQLFYQRQSKHPLDQVHFLVSSIIFHILKIVLINGVCKHAASEGKKTIEIIRQIYGCCQDTNIREEIQQFDLQISQSPVEFFTFGLTLNYQLLTSCLTTVTTYMVIMIQMSISLESSKNS
ncbi:PREDICTED: gustatory receptor for sugar taste 43a-like [Dinoponera quadriceps]|uniref:Gustatory receptor for sugar taste 43a-like n=1 Tax=Dinoponera quadriceps TaxID=609295 RepID=A0A6P3XWU8_DINQU|nr:PREDICTED: gustatory receptor for sugar taste 43a-like [Dinoponera quadriceps]